MCVDTSRMLAIGTFMSSEKIIINSQTKIEQNKCDSYPVSHMSPRPRHFRPVADDMVRSTRRRDMASAAVSSRAKYKLGKKNGATVRLLMHWLS